MNRRKSKLPVNDYFDSERQHQREVHEAIIKLRETRRS